MLQKASARGGRSGYFPGGLTRSHIIYQERYKKPAIYPRVMVFAGTASGRLLALDGREGRLLWKTKARVGLRGPVLVAAGRVYASGRDGYVYSWDVRGGRNMKRYYAGQGGAAGRPAITDRNTVYIASKDGRIFQYNIKTTEAVHIRHLKTAPLTGLVPVGKNLLLGHKGGLLALAPRQKLKTVYDIKTPNPVRNEPLINKDRLIFSSGKLLYYAEKSGGRVLHKRRLRGRILAPPLLVSKERVALLTTANRVRYIHPNGKHDRGFPLTFQADSFFMSGHANRRDYYFIYEGRNLHIIQQSAGKPRSVTFRLRADARNRAAARRDIIYATDRHGLLYAVDLQGRLLWTFRAGERVDTDLVVAD